MGIYKIKDSLHIDSILMVASEKWSWADGFSASYSKENLCRTIAIM